MNPKRQAWLVMLAAYLGGVAVALNQTKVPPVMQVLMERLHMDATTGGWLMSSFAVAGIILGIPAAFVLGKLGPKPSGLIALGCTVLGSAVGALANEPAMLLLGRAVEGVGLGLITVVAPAVISMWFPPEERGLPMGIWASWVPVGGFLMLNLAGPFLGAFGWQGIWWFGALVALAAFAIYAAFVRTPPAIAAAPGQSGPRLGGMLLNRSSWILAFVFATFNLSFGGLNTWTPSYFNKALGLSADVASFDASLMSLAVIPSTILAGWVLDRTRNRALVLTIALAISSFMLFWSFQLGDASIIAPYMLSLGLVAGFIPTATFTLAPETVTRSEYAGLALGIVSVGQNVGMFIGPPVVGAVVGGGNWAAGVIPLVAALVLGLAASLSLYTRQPRTAPGIESQQV